MTSAAKQTDDRPKASLRILPESTPLRRGGAMHQPLDWFTEEGAGSPRALRSLSRIVDGGLCHRCGSCVGICPTGVLALDSEEYPKVKNLSACTDCDLCVKVCPGDEFNFHEMHQKKFGTPGDISDTHGQFIESFIGYSNDPELRKNGTSGGLVTAILLDLLAQKQIDGAIVISSDKDQLWKGKPIVARTPEELLAATKSKYAISPTNSVWSEIREIPGRYALVGLPCQIHGFEKAAELDKRIKERVVLTIGLYCHSAVEHEGYRIIWDSLGDFKNEAVRFVSRIGKHPGTPHLVLKDGSMRPVYFPEKQGYRPSSMEIINILYRLYSPERCLTCYDSSAEFADISVGDPWLAPPDDDVDFYNGWSFALVRTERARKIIAEMRERQTITVKDLTRREALSCNTMMSHEKRWRAFRIIETHRRQGKAIPAYGPYPFILPRPSPKQFLKTEINMFTHLFCFMPKWRKPLMEFTLSNGGYCLLWINNWRRNARIYLRDSLAWTRRKLFGRK